MSVLLSVFPFFGGMNAERSKESLYTAAEVSSTGAERKVSDSLNSTVRDRPNMEYMLLWMHRGISISSSMEAVLLGSFMMTLSPSISIDAFRKKPFTGFPVYLTSSMSVCSASPQNVSSGNRSLISILLFGNFSEKAFLA